MYYFLELKPKTLKKHKIMSISIKSNFFLSNYYFTRQIMLGSARKYDITWAILTEVK